MEIDAYDHGVPSWIDVFTDDPDATATFFTELFGWECPEGPAEFAGYRSCTLNGRTVAGILAHRRWALGHRHEFNLLFTDLLPGFEAPAGGPTVDAQVAVFQPMIDALVELVPDGTRPLEHTAVLVWTAFHGVVQLEVNHHLDWLDDPAAVHEEAVRRAFAGAGFPDPAPTMRRRFERWAAKHPA